MNDGKNNQQVAREVGVHRETVIYWRRRWLEDVPRLTAAELNDCSDGELLVMIEEVLMDEPRERAPVKFTSEQVVQIMALAGCLSQEVALLTRLQNRAPPDSGRFYLERGVSKGTAAGRSAPSLQYGTRFPDAGKSVYTLSTGAYPIAGYTSHCG